MLFALQLRKSRRLRQCRGPSLSPFSTRRIISARSIGNADRLAMVRFLTRPPSRILSRRRIAGGERRFGTMSIYVDAMYANRLTAEVSHSAAYMGTCKRSHTVLGRTNPRTTAILPIPRRH